MKILEISIENFRGIKSAKFLLPGHAVLVGDNNTGKSTVLEAIDLVMGPDRLSRRPPVDEHDFYQGQYLAREALGDQPGQPAPLIRVDLTIGDLSDAQQARFNAHVEWWDSTSNKLYDEPNPEGVDAGNISAAMGLTFIGKYDEEEDDFVGRSYFSSTLDLGDDADEFGRRDKQHCGFVYLRGSRTGSRALSLEHGSLLDIILRLKEIRPKMWESTLTALGGLNVAADPALGLSGVLTSINDAMKKYVPKEWGAEPHLRVSQLTREHLRKVITAFVATGGADHAAPFYRQGNGTINMLVLAMLSLVAEDKQNVIFAMEELETAIPPYAQKRIVHELRTLSAQSICTSHSPYVLEEFSLDETVVLARNDQGVLSRAALQLPDSVKHKRYRQQFRTRFCEGLLSRRVLIVEGATEAASLPTAARRLNELDPKKYASLESLGLCVLDAGTETQIADLGGFYRALGKRVFGACDKQEAASKALIEAQVEKLYMHHEKGFENLVLKNTTNDALQRFCDIVDWPPHLNAKFPNPKADAENAVGEYFLWAKGNWGVADFLAQCSEAEIPQWIRAAIIDLKAVCDPPKPKAQAGGAAAGAPNAP